MSFPLLLIALQIIVFQVDPSRAARDLIEKLRSARAEDRDEVARQLKDLGAVAIPELEKASKDSDLEVSVRARQILQILSLRKTLTIRLQKAVPGLAERLASGGDSEWTKAFLELHDQPKSPPLQLDELSPLAARALKGANDGQEKSRVLLLILQNKHVSALPQVCLILSDPKSVLRLSALEVMVQIVPREARINAKATALPMNAADFTQAIAALALNHEPTVRSELACALGDLGAAESVPTLIALLTDENIQVRLHALCSLGLLRTREATLAVSRLMADPDPSLRAMATLALGRIGGDEAGCLLITALKDNVPSVRAKAAHALAQRASAGASIALRGLLQDDAKLNDPLPLQQFDHPLFCQWTELSGGPLRDATFTITPNDPQHVRGWAASSLCRMGDPSGIETVFKELTDETDYTDLFALNAIRQPAVWKMLHEGTMNELVRDSVPRLLVRILKQAGLEADLGKCELGDDQLTLCRPSSLLEALEELLRRKGHGAILEKDRVRIVPSDEEAGFWRSWLKDKRKK